MNSTLIAIAAFCGIAGMLSSWAMTLIAVTSAYEPEPRTRRQRLAGNWSNVLAWVFAAFGSFSFVMLGVLL